jgi:hypothetical protein
MLILNLINSEVIVDRATDILNELLRFMQLETTLKIEIQGIFVATQMTLSYLTEDQRLYLIFLIRNGIATKIGL